MGVSRQQSPVTVTVLGCGTSSGVPLIGCDCEVCRSSDPKNNRLRASIWLRLGDKSIVIDTSTDFRQQALREKIPRVDAVLYTHPHTDHIHGIDELRSYNFLQRTSIPLYGNSWTCTELGSRFEYIFKPLPTSNEGGGIPLLELREFKTSDTQVDVLGIPFVPISLHHGSKECVGYRLGNFAYITDTQLIPESSYDRLKGLDTLILDCVRIKPHRTHLNWDRALEEINRIQPKKTYLTHMGHDFEYQTWQKKLPTGVHLAYDGLKFSSMMGEGI